MPVRTAIFGGEYPLFRNTYNPNTVQHASGGLVTCIAPVVGTGFGIVENFILPNAVSQHVFLQIVNRVHKTPYVSQ